MEIKIRKLKSSDLQAAYRLGVEQFGGEYWFSRKFIRETALSTGHHLVACLGKRIVGVILIKTLDRPKVWIYYFVVAKDCRRRGIGTLLLKAGEEKCTYEFPLIFVDIGTEDVEAKNFYEKHGFIKQARIDDWFDLKVAGLIYSKKLK